MNEGSGGGGGRSIALWALDRELKTYRIAGPLEVSNVHLRGGRFGVEGFFGHGDELGVFVVEVVVMTW